MIDVLKEREHIADVLIKAKSLAEFVIEETIKKDHEGLIVFDGNLPKIIQVFLIKLLTVCQKLIRDY